MAIYTERVVMVNKDTAKMDNDIYIYKGNRNICIQFKIIDSQFKFRDVNLVDKFSPSHGYVTLINPEGEQIATGKAEIENATLKLTVTSGMIDEDTEVGDYTIVIDLYDEVGDSLLTIPPIYNQLHVLKRVTDVQDIPDEVRFVYEDDGNLQTVNIDAYVEGAEIKTINKMPLADTAARQDIEEIKTAYSGVSNDFDQLEKNVNSTIAALDARIDLDMDDLADYKEEVNAQFNTIASERVINFEELKSKINSRVKNNFLEICGVIEVSEDIEVPNDLTLKFNNHGKIIIKSGKTLKINCNIDAGYYKIFDFEDDTANLSVDESFQNNTQNTINRYEIKLAWFGAEGKASYNFETGTIDGVDESKPIKRAMKFATLCSANYPNYGALSYVKILGSPNSNYYVTDDNILGCQSDSVTGVKFNFEGNGCTFYYNPSNENNSFIGNGKKINRPTYKNFGVYPFGFVGRKGYFFNTNGGDTFNSGVQGYFENVVIGDSYLLTKNCGFNILFNIEGNNMIDNFIIERCRLSFANKILYNTNSEAVNWKFVRCGISTCTENGVAIHYENTSYGGVKLEDCEMILYSNNETLLKYNNPTVHETYANFKISGRIECRQSNFTLIDVNSGVVDVEGLNITYGAGWTPNENTICAKVFKSGQVNFKNCILPLINIVEVTESKYLTRKKAIIFDDCAFFNNSKVLQSYPQIKIKSPNGIFDYYSIFSTKFCHNDIVVKNVKYNNNGAGGYDITYSCKDRKRFNVRLADKYDNGKIILPYDSYTLFPDFVNLTELKLYYEKTSNIDEIRLLFFNEDGGNSYTEYINLNFFNSGDDLLENKVICLQKGVTLQFKFFKNSIEVTDTTLYPFSFVDIEYTNMLGYKDYNTGVLGAYPIHVV